MFAEEILANNVAKSWTEKPNLIFILGGPGAGKSTQSKRIQKAFGYTHLSAGDLLRAECSQESSKYGAMINEMIANGAIVPGEITLGLIIQAIHNTENNKFIIDGFPRNMDNFNIFFEHLAPYIEIITMIHFDCPEEIMCQRLMGRAENSGRCDDNVQSMMKRFETYRVSTVPIVKEFEKMNKSIHVDSSQPIEVVEASLASLFTELSKQS